MKRFAPYVVVVALAGALVGVAVATAPPRAAAGSTRGPHAAFVPAGNGQPDNGARVDSRLVSDVTTLVARYHVMVVAGCGGGRPWGPHAPYGEHPICDAVDLVPQDDRNPHWPTMMRLARALGWRPSCERIGCEGSSTLNRSLRAIYYNGYPGHGDPAHNRTSAHLHISWEHAPVASASYRRTLDRHPRPAAAWVDRIYRPRAATPRPSTPTTASRRTAKRPPARPKRSPKHATAPRSPSGGESPTGRSTPPAGGASFFAGA